MVRSLARAVWVPGDRAAEFGAAAAEPDAAAADSDIEATDIDRMGAPAPQPAISPTSTASSRGAARRVEVTVPGSQMRTLDRRQIACEMAA